jgi:hypothetical protein
MDTARRLGIFCLVLAFILYSFSTQADPADTALQGRLVVFRILFALLGFILVTRYRTQARESSRFSWIRNFLFKRKDRDRKKAERSRKGRDKGRRNSET